MPGRNVSACAHDISPFTGAFKLLRCLWSPLNGQFLRGAYRWSRFFDHPGTIMISIVLYGRNDSYGYNLHKRGALSLNCMAELLTDPADEILFVDYNTPDDFPTFPEAIRDTLTKRARKIMRIFRVRPHIHERYKSRTHLKALEPIARNVAVRRSNPSNRWILSTNTDMIFVPQHGGSLTEIARDLPAGFYHAPRIEIPEALWESFDRLAAGNIIRTVREWGSALHVNEIVLGSKFIRYDGPGDFQLLLRSDLFENYGFDEDMLLGWHVDSNIAARLQSKYKAVGDLGEQIYGYHCDHTRQVTPAHSHERLQNDWKKFVDDVVRSDAPQQAASWGCAGDAIEEVRIAVDPASVYVQALREVIGKPLAAPKIVTYTGETYNKVDYDPPHLMPFLADMFVSMPRNLNVGWYGVRDETLRLFADIWQRLGFTGKIFLERDFGQQDRTGSVIQDVGLPELLAEADTFVFDFGGLQPASVASAGIDRLTGEMLRSFRRVVRDERHRISTGAPPGRIIALNAINNAFEWFVCGSVAAAATPFATHMRHGFVLPGSAALGDWLPLLATGEAGVRVGQHEIRSDPSTAGWIAYGPFKYLEQGRYLISLEIERFADDRDRPGNRPSALVEVVAGPELLGVYPLEHLASPATHHRFTFDVSQNVADGIAALETRIGVPHPIEIALKALTIEPAPASINTGCNRSEIVRAAATFAQLDDWLPFLQSSRNARQNHDSIVVSEGRAEYAIYGPYWTLPAGHYDLLVSIVPPAPNLDGKPVVILDVATDGGERQVVRHEYRLGQFACSDAHAAMELRLPFTLAADLPAALRTIETRIYTPGDGSFRVRSLAVKVRSNEPTRNWFPYLTVGECGIHAGCEIKSAASKVGCVAYTPAMDVASGHYQLFLDVVDTGANVAEPSPEDTVEIEIYSEAEILAIQTWGRGSNAQSDPLLAFDVTEEIASGSGIELYIRAIRPAAVSVRGLRVERTSNKLARSPALLQAKRPLSYFHVGAVGLREERGVSSRPGKAGNIGYIRCRLPPGRYETVVKVERVGGDPVGHLTITVGANLLASQGIEFTPRILGPIRIPRGPFRICTFEVPAGSRRDALNTEVRIDSTGAGAFLIRSITVKPKTWLRDLRDKTYGVSAKMLRVALNKFEVRRS